MFQKIKKNTFWLWLFWHWTGLLSQITVNSDNN
jgi:hypothetical protein